MSKLTQDKLNELFARTTRPNLSNADLTATSLKGISLRKANMFKANLAGMDLTDTGMVGAYLYKTNLSNANLQGVNLAGANLTGADLSSANLFQANLEGVIFFQTRIPSRTVGKLTREGKCLAENLPTSTS